MKLDVSKNKDQLWVQYQGKIYSLAVNKKSSHAGANTESEDLIAPFTCKVLKVHAKKGASLKQGEAVVVVEAMKMEYSYTSPRDGVVAEVLVQEGMIVNQGQHFVRWQEKK